MTEYDKIKIKYNATLTNKQNNKKIDKNDFTITTREILAFLKWGNEKTDSFWYPALCNYLLKNNKNKRSIEEEIEYYFKFIIFLHLKTKFKESDWVVEHKVTDISYEANFIRKIYTN